MAEFKPNIYPIMYWALAFGIFAGVALYVLSLLAQFITSIWVPVFIAGMVWGAYRNYQIQKKKWSATSGTPIVSGTPMQEFKQAFQDVREASRSMIAQQNQAATLPEESSFAEATEDKSAEEATPETIETLETVEETSSSAEATEDKPVATPPTPPVI